MSFSSLTHLSSCGTLFVCQNPIQYSLQLPSALVKDTSKNEETSSSSLSFTILSMPSDEDIYSLPDIRRPSLISLENYTPLMKIFRQHRNHWPAENNRNRIEPHAHTSAESTYHPCHMSWWTERRVNTFAFIIMLVFFMLFIFLSWLKKEMRMANSNQLSSNTSSLTNHTSTD